MIKKVLTIFLAVMLIAMIAVIASTVDKRSTLDKKSLLKPVKSKVLPERAKKELTQETSSAALRKIQSSLQQSADTIWTDDFEGGQENWQATGTWGSRDAPGGGRYDEPKSDWGLVTDNFNSPTTSWQNTGTSLPGNDMVLSPVITLPTEVTVDGNTSPLKQTTLNMAMDFDADPDNHAIMLLIGLAEELWTTTTTDPGAGSSSWVLVLPESPPYDVQNRHFLTTPDIDLTGATAPVTLSFLYKSISEPEFDYNKVDVSTDNFVTYDSVFSHAGGITPPTGGIDTWTTANADLSSYVGSTIRLRFSVNGDDGTIEPGNIFALDNIDVSDAGGSLFSDDGGDTPTSMEVAGFVPGDYLWFYGGFPAEPTPNWVTWEAYALTADVLAGANGAIEPGDDIRIGLRYNSFGAPPGRGLYIDDVVITGVGQFEHDVAAQTVECPFVAQVNKAQKFTLNISNEGLNPEVNFTWRGRIFDSAGTQVGQVIGQVTDTIKVGETGSAESTTSWTPTASGVYQIQGITALATDSESENDTTQIINTGDGASYTAFYVTAEDLVWAAKVDDAPADPTVATLEGLGFQVKSNSAAGVVTWHTGGDPRTNLPGAVVYFDTLQRYQDEELIIPNLDFSYITSDAKLNFYGFGVGGFTYTRISASVSMDGGYTWHDVWERRRGIDPQTGTDYGGPAYLRSLMNPADVDITDHVAGYHNVWVRFRYEADWDESWVVWKIALSGAGVKAADLTNIADVPNDNGKQVRLTWDASPNDGQLNGVPISHYGVWREVNGGGTTTSAPVGMIEVQNIREMIELANTTQIKTSTRVFHTQTQQAWDFVANVTAHSDPVYNYVAPTLEDGVSTNFMISAHTANPEVFANSNVLAGTSIDNLPPAVPQNLAAQVKFDGQNYSVELSWDPNEDEDLRNYTVYKGGQLLSHTIENSIVDTDVQMGETVAYAVTASDHADNESGGAETTVLVTGIEDDLANVIPTEFALDQNYPNPFNPTTTIKFALKENADVLLEIYNVQGQLVRTLVRDNMTAGYKEVVWDATNNYGTRVASGIYIYKIEASDFVKSMKMILLK